MKDSFEKAAQALIAGKEDELKQLTQTAIDNGATAKDFLEQGLLEGMSVVGVRFKAGDMFIPEVLNCARCMHAAMDILKPLLSEGDESAAGTFLIGSVEGDVHDIGKNLVGMMLHGAGFKVVDLGTGVTPQQFVDGIKEHNANILGMSALLTTTMPKMKETIDAIAKAGLRDNVRIMCGGAPVTQEYVDEIGADAYGANAGTAAELAKKLVA